MADLATLAIIATAVGTAASVGGTIYASQQAAQSEEYQARVAESQGQQAMLAATAEAEDRRRRARYLLGEQLTASGASGLALEGSPLLAMVESGVQEDLEARRTLYKGYLAKTGAATDASLARYQAGQYRTSGYIQAGTSLLRGGTNVYGRATYGSNWSK